MLNATQNQKILQGDFFARSSLEVAPELLGKMLCRVFDDGSVVKMRINEVEAYGGPEDLASHARFGLTKRNSVMFGPPARWYVYLCYGIHWMLNIVTEAEGKAGGVLFRGVGNYNGPGCLTKALFVDGKFSGKLCSPLETLWIEEGATKPQKFLRTPRIGVDYAGKVWAKKMYRFVLPECISC